MKLSALFQSFSFQEASFFRIQITKASYQSTSFVLIVTTFRLGTSSKVTGTKVLSFTILVISNLCANNQAIIFKDNYETKLQYQFYNKN